MSAISNRTVPVPSARHVQPRHRKESNFIICMSRADKTNGSDTKREQPKLLEEACLEWFRKAREPVVASFKVDLGTQYCPQQAKTVEDLHNYPVFHREEWKQTFSRKLSTFGEERAAPVAAVICHEQVPTVRMWRPEAINQAALDKMGTSHDLPTHEHTFYMFCPQGSFRC